MIFTTASGTLKGPKISGTIVDPSADWLIPMPDGSLRLDVRATIKTGEGEFILTEYNGVIVVTKDVTDRLSKGETITYIAFSGRVVLRPSPLCLGLQSDLRA